MAGITSAAGQNVVKVVVSSEGWPRTTSAFAPFAQFAADWQRQWTVALTAPLVKVIQANQCQLSLGLTVPFRNLLQEHRQFQVAALAPILQIRPLLDELAISQVRLAVGSLQASVYSSAFAILKQQPWDKLAGISASASGFANPSACDLLATEAVLRTRLQQTRDHPDAVQQGAGQIAVDHERLKLFSRMVLALRRQVTTLTPWACLVLVTWFLLKLADEQGEKASNDLMVITIVFMVAVYLWPPRS
jgi:hypothetical protein